MSGTLACADAPRDGETAVTTPQDTAGLDTGSTSIVTTSGLDEGSTADPGAEGSSSSTGPLDSLLYDVLRVPDVPGTGDCGAPSPVSCDDDEDADPFQAIGLNCPGGPQVEGVYNGDPMAIHIHEGELGTFMPPPYPPREGDKFVILSSGIASDMLIPGYFAAADVMGAVIDGVPIDNGSQLPEPMVAMNVSDTETCTENAALVGTGDCSNTIEAQWVQGSGAYDYNELRMNIVVPAGTTGFSYDLAMFSTEYPNYYQTQYNDMYIAWLESEQWTGNVSFDEAGNPISLNAGFLDYKDAPNPYDCPAPCAAPELAGTAMMGHAGTKWLTTSAPVTPGEQIELVFAVYDLSDPVLDTVILLDHWLWNCDGGPPVTVPG